MGGTKHGLRNQISLDLWQFAIENNIWLSITHIPGISNYLADNASRVIYNPRTEWALKQCVFDDVVKALGPVDIDLFASAINHKLDNYVSWKQDPMALHCDAFTMNWDNLNVFIFSPFSMMPEVLHKLTKSANVTGIIVYPLWDTQPWYPAVQRLCQKTISLPQKSVFNPIKGAGLMPTKSRFLAGRF